jgi:hypothetical protein
LVLLVIGGGADLVHQRLVVLFRFEISLLAAVASSPFVDRRRRLARLLSMQVEH